MYRDRLVLTETSWSIKNSDFIFDILILISFVSLYSLAGYDSPIKYLYVFLALFIPMLVYSLVLKKLNIYSYMVGSFIHSFFVLLTIPTVWMNPWVLFLISSFSFMILFYGKKYSFQIPLFLVFFILLYSVYFLFSGLEVADSSPIWYNTLLWKSLPQEGIFGEGRIGLLESLGPFVLGFISLAVFRRPVVFLSGLWFYLISIFFYKDLGWEASLIPGITTGTIFFLSFLLPGRNHYASLWISQLFSVIVFFILFISLKTISIELSFGMVLILFFLLESFVLKNTLAHKPKGKR
jgi:hypothetical protein